jgi:hypothetical protein
VDRLSDLSNKSIQCGNSVLYVRYIKEIAKIVTSHQNDLNFGRSQIQTPEIAITFYYRIVDGHTEFPHYSNVDNLH